MTVVSFTGNSGLTDYSVSLCKELDKYVDLTFVTAGSYEPNQYDAKFSAVKLFRRTRHYPIDIIKFFFYILKNKPDILLLQSWIKYPALEWILLVIFKWSGITLALTIHDLLPHYPRPWSKFVLSKYYRLFDKLIVHSEKSKEGLRRLGIGTLPLFVPHGIYDIFNQDCLSKQDVLPHFPMLGRHDFVVLFFGHIQTRKGIEEFLGASDLLANIQSIKFLVAGRNDLNDTEKQCLNIYRENTNVLIHDELIPMEKVQHYFAVADVVALPYLEGTTSGVVKLAMAFDKPIIATDIGDFPETLKDWSGLLIGNDDIPQDLASAIQVMQSNYADFISNLSEKKEKFSWSNIAKKYFNYLTE